MCVKTTSVTSWIVVPVARSCSNRSPVAVPSSENTPPPRSTRMVRSPILTMNEPMSMRIRTRLVYGVLIAVPPPALGVGDGLFDGNASDSVEQGNDLEPAHHHVSV